MSTAPTNPRQLPSAALAAAVADAAVAGDQCRMDNLDAEVRYRAAEPTADPMPAGCAATVAGLIAALRARALSDRARWDELAAEHGEAGQDWQEERCYGRVSQCDDLLRNLAEAEAQLVDVAEPAAAMDDPSGAIPLWRVDTAGGRLLAEVRGADYDAARDAALKIPAVAAFARTNSIYFHAIAGECR